MADVGGRPFVAWLIRELEAQEIRRVIFCTGYRAEVIEECFGAGRGDLEFLYSPEASPLGTAGALRHAMHLVRGDRFLALNGDSYTPIEIPRLLEAHRERKARATLWLVPVDDCRRYGSVAIDPNGAVLRFDEKITNGVASSGLINAGVYLLERDLLSSLPEGVPASLETEVLPGWIGRGLFGVQGPGPFLDIGTPESYAYARKYFLSDILR